MITLYIITLVLQLITVGAVIYDIIKDKYIENCSKEILDAVAGIEGGANRWNL